MRTTVRRRLLAGLLSVASGTALALVPSAAQADSTDPLGDREGDTPFGFDVGTVTLAGTSYPDSLLFDLRGEDAGDVVSRSYDLAARCSRLTATTGLGQETEQQVRVRFQVYADDVLRSDVELGTGTTAPLALDVAGVRQLRLAVTVVQASFFTQLAAFGTASVTCTGVTPGTVTASPSGATVAAGSGTTLSGVVADEGGSPVPGTAVQVQSRENGEQDFTTVATATTDDAGRWASAVRPRFSTRYRVVVPAAGRRAEVRGATEPVVAVRSLLSINAQRLGTREYRFYGTLRPARSGRTVSLFRRSGGREVLVSRTTVDSRGVYDIRRTFTGSGRFDVLVRFGADGYSSAAASPLRPTAVY